MNNLYKNSLYLTFIFVSFIFYGYFLGDDIGPDLQNHHFYRGFLGLHSDHLPYDILPAGVESYLTPYYHSFLYILRSSLTPKLLNAFLSFIHSFNFILLFLLSNKVLNFYKIPHKNKVSVLITLIGITNPFFLTMVGASWEDNFLPILILLALFFLINIFLTDSDKKINLNKKYFFKNLFMPGILFGIALGFKLTIICFVIGAFLGLFLLLFDKSVSIISFFKSVFIFSTAVLIGFILINGNWMYKLYYYFDNPVFPFFNDIFQSKKIIHIFTNQPAWAAAKNISDYFVMPVNWARGIPNNSEWPFRDYSYVILYFSFFLWLIKSRNFFIYPNKINFAKSITNNKIFIFFIIFFVFSYYIWLMRFGALRYFVPGSFMIGILIFFFLYKAKFSINLIILFLLIFLSVNLKFQKMPPFGRLDWKNAWFENVQINDILTSKPYIFFTPGISLLFPLLNEKSIYYQFNRIDKQDEFFSKIQSSVNNPTFPLRTLSSWPWLKEYDLQLEQYGIKRDFTNCVESTIKYVLEYQSCSVIKIDERIKVSYPIEINFSKFHMPYVKEVLGIDRNWTDTNKGKGNWTIGKEAKIVLNFDLPKKFKLVIEAFPYNKNSEESYTIQIGKDIRRFNFDDTENQNHRIELIFSDINENLKEINFNIPNPTSPSSISTSPDQRELGLFIKNIYITEIN